MCTQLIHCTIASHDVFKHGAYLESGGGEADQIGMVVGKRKLLCLGVRVCECDSLQKDTKHYQICGDMVTSTILCDYMTVVCQYTLQQLTLTYNTL